MFVFHEILSAEGMTIGAMQNPLVAAHANHPDVHQRMVEHARKAIDFAETLFRRSPVGNCLNDVLAAKHYLDKPDILTASSLQVILNRLKADLILNFRCVEVVQIASDRQGLLDSLKPLGEAVATAFPSAARDLTDAHNCYAVECGTAAVFHLMRATEFAMRALARDRRVSFADKPFEQKEWGQILPHLESKAREWRDGRVPASIWPDASLREKQIQFYHEVIQELRSFNEAWRRHVSHADAEAFYDRDQTKSIVEHVGNFMKKLATKISEGSITDEFWKSYSVFDFHVVKR